MDLIIIVSVAVYLAGVGFFIGFFSHTASSGYSAGGA